MENKGHRCSLQGGGLGSQAASDPASGAGRAAYTGVGVLDRAIKTSGVVAGDAECYTTFAPLFDKVIITRPALLLPLNEGTRTHSQPPLGP